MHNPPKYTAKNCHGGCVCKKGFVLEPITKECVKPADCPCHHGGRSYADQEVVKEDCNTWYANSLTFAQFLNPHTLRDGKLDVQGMYMCPAEKISYRLEKLKIILVKS